MKRTFLAAGVVLCLAAPVRAEDFEDTNLKGRGWGRGVALAWNKASKTERRVVLIGIAGVMVAGGAVGAYRFVRETKDLMEPKEKKPWDGL